MRAAAVRIVGTPTLALQESLFRRNSMNFRESRIISLMIAVSLVFIGGCGGSSDTTDAGPATGTVSFGITDLPVDDVSEVVIAMTEFELKPAGEGPSFTVPVNDDGRQLNLLDFQDGNAATVIDGEEVPAGDYEWLRIFFDEEFSYVTLDDGTQHDLLIPSGDQTGYKLQSGFTVPINDSVTYMLHIDVAQSLQEPPGQAGPDGKRTFLLKPVVEIMNVAETGSVMGAVDMTLLDVNNSRCTDPDPDLTGNAVYIFDGADALLDDIASPDADGRPGPFATDRVDLNIDSGNYEYNFAYLLPGTYTIAFTCSTSADDEGSDDDFVKAEGSGDMDPYVSGDSGFDFDQAINVEVQSNVESNCPIPAGDTPTETCTPTP
jgi:hypothetical protein